MLTDTQAKQIINSLIIPIKQNVYKKNVLRTFQWKTQDTMLLQYAVFNMVNKHLASTLDVEYFDEDDWKFVANNYFKETRTSE